MIDPNYYQNKYRVNSIRLQSWDYSSPGIYFVTICTKNKIPWFGYIKNSIMGLNIIGCIVNKYYLEIPDHCNCILDEYIIMPNHVHGIIEILDDGSDVINYNNVDNKTVCGRDEACQGINVDNTIGCRDGACLENVMINKSSRDGACPVSTKRHTLSNMVGSFKSVCTKEIHKIGYPKFEWQSRFYEHIIRTNTESLEKIRHYIKYNPKYWNKDKNYL